MSSAEHSTAWAATASSLQARAGPHPLRWLALNSSFVACDSSPQIWHLSFCICHFCTPEITFHPFSSLITYGSSIDCISTRMDGYNQHSWSHFLGTNNKCYPHSTRQSVFTPYRDELCCPALLYLDTGQNSSGSETKDPHHVALGVSYGSGADALPGKRLGIAHELPGALLWAPG